MTQLHPSSASMGLERTVDPSKEMATSLVYNPYWFDCYDEELLASRFEGYSELTRIQRYVFKHFVNVKKIVGSWNIACHLIRKGLKEGVVITDDDIIWAYAVGAGGGAEFEFPYE